MLNTQSEETAAAAYFFRSLQTKAFLGNRPPPSTVTKNTHSIAMGVVAEGQRKSFPPLDTCIYFGPSSSYSRDSHFSIYQ